MENSRAHGDTGRDTGGDTGKSDGLGSSEARSAQARPFRSPAHEAVVELFRTTDRVRRALSAVVEEHGLTLQQFNVLRILRGAGSAGLPTLEVAERMVERTPGVTRMLDRLERQELIRRDRCPRDRRRVLASITEKGLGRLERVDEPMAKREEELFGSASSSEVATLLVVFRRLRLAASASPSASSSDSASDDPKKSLAGAGTPLPGDARP
jgi:DNA-binding MarR family transcriptional regulator